MNIKKILLILLILICFIGTSAYIIKRKNVYNDYQTTNTQTNIDNQRVLSISEIASHNSATSCWTVVNNNVYDVTSWIKQHPGGEKAILGMCGKDATSAFTNKHGGQQRPESELSNFKIGILQ